METQELIGFENLLGRRVLEDERAVKALDEIKRAVESYEAVLVALAIEYGVHPNGKEEE